VIITPNVLIHSRVLRVVDIATGEIVAGVTWVDTSSGKCRHLLKDDKGMAVVEAPDGVPLIAERTYPGKVRVEVAP